MSGQLQHIVLFRFPEALSADDETWMREQIRSWPERIGGFRAMRFGSDLTGARSEGYQYLLFQEFADAEALRTYQAHPVHQEFFAWIRERGVQVIAYDYYVDATTSIV